MGGEERAGHGLRAGASSVKHSRILCRSDVLLGVMGVRRMYECNDEMPGGSSSLLYFGYSSNRIVRYEDEEVKQD